MRKTWDKIENEILLSRINEYSDDKGRIFWKAMPVMRNRTLKAMEVQWHMRLKKYTKYNGTHYVFEDRPAVKVITKRAHKPKQPIKQIRTYLWGMYKIETYA